MANEVATKPAKPLDRLKLALSTESVRAQFQNALKDNAGPFIASIIDLYGSDRNLQECEPSAVIMEALKAATLKLPINKQLGFAYIVPYRSKGQAIPQFQIGYKGYIQLAMRTGQYRYLNADMVYEGMTVVRNHLTGEMTFTGEPTSSKPVGYFCYMELLNGFSKVVYMTRDEIVEHAKRYSKSWGRDSSAWSTNFDEMALKTVARRLLSKYGILSTEMVTALSITRDEEDAEEEAEREVASQANGEIIDVQATSVDAPEAGGQNGQPQPQQASLEGPGF
ncbi:MAG: recombinase RecT [Pigmentiphaga sp.]